jgi:hypothetical protein
MNTNDLLMNGRAPHADGAPRVAAETPGPLPTDLRRWVSEPVLVAWVLGIVADLISQHRQTPESPLSERHPPLPTMLTVLTYCYVTGRYPSDEIEGAALTDRTVRYLCANHFVASTAVRRFRRVHRGLLRFCVLSLYRRAWHHRFGLTEGASNLPPGPGRGESQREAALSDLFATAAEEKIQHAILADTMAMDV